MPCYKLLQTAQNCAIAPIMAADANERHNASLYHKQRNALLPDDAAETLLPDDTAEPEGAAAISSSTGYRADVQALRPARRRVRHLGFAGGPFNLKGWLKKTEGPG